MSRTRRRRRRAGSAAPPVVGIDTAPAIVATEAAARQGIVNALGDVRAAQQYCRQATVARRAWRETLGVDQPVEPDAAGATPRLDARARVLERQLFDLDRRRGRRVH
jgi:hypothetical protein